MNDSSLNKYTYTWWSEDCDPESRAQVAWSNLETLRHHQLWRVQEGRAAERMYESGSLRAVRRGDTVSEDFFGGGSGDEGGVGGVHYNCMQINFDTLTSKILQALPGITTGTTNEDFEVRQKAEVLQRVIAAIREAVGYETKAEERIVDMLLYGFGALRWYVDPDKKVPKVKRRHPLDLWFDELEARDTAPRTMYDALVVSRKGLIAQYPEKEDQIRMSGLGQVQDLYPLDDSGQTSADLCEVVEAWRLARDGHKGYYIKFTSAALLEFEDFDERHFPYGFQFWLKRRRGPYPISAATQVMKLQLVHNKLLRRLHYTIHKLAATRVIYDAASGLSPHQFRTSGVGDLLPMDMAGRGPPVVMNPSVVPPDIVAALQQLEMQIASTLGVTGLESSGAPPQGVDSAPSLQEYSNQSSLRHYKTLKESERAVICDTKQMLRTLWDCQAKYGNVKIMVEAMGDLETADFSQFDLPPSAYKISLTPANAFSLIPQQRLSQIMQVSQSGLMSPAQLVRAMTSPDITAITADITAAQKEIEWMIFEMSKPGGRFFPPGPTTDFALGTQLVSAAYNRLKRQRAPGDVLARLDQWLQQAQKKQSEYAQIQQALAMAQAAQAQAAQAAQGGKPGGGGPPAGPPAPGPGPGGPGGGGMPPG